MMNNHSIHINLFLACLAAIICILPMSAGAPADSVAVYFRMGRSHFDAAYENNGASMETFIESLRKATGSVDSVVVRGYVSPDGHYIHDPLSQKRCDEVAEYITRQTGISPDIVKTEYIGVDWTLLRKLVSETPDVPAREEILDVIDNSPAWIYNASGKIIDGRNKRLMNIAGGRPYRWIKTNLFPEFRKAVAVSFVGSPVNNVTEVITETPAVPETSDNPERSDNQEYHDYQISLDDAGTPDNIDIPESPDEYEVAKAVLPEKDHKFFMALKTNMLYDAALVPNLAAEFYIGKNLSIYGEWMYAWWDSYNRHRYWRIYGGDAGLRWWFGKKAKEKPLTGHHLGVFAGALTFDFELGDYGYMGGKPGGTLWDRCLVNSGIEYGYSLPVGSRLNIDFSVSLGYMGGKYIKYFPFDNEYYSQKQYKLRYFGPTKAEISLVWLIGHGNVNRKKGGDR